VNTSTLPEPEMTPMATMTTPTLAEMRASYRRAALAGRFMFGPDWDAAVLATLGRRGLSAETATPADWIDAAGTTTLECNRCRGTGIYCWGGTINGKPVHTGDCYQCGGAGTQDQDDMHRNRAHVLHAISRAI
jgi:hypothetical protein